MSYYAELKFKVKNREKFLEVLKKRWEIDDIPEADRKVWYISMINKNNRIPILLMLREDGTVEYDVSVLSDQSKVQEELLYSIQDYVLENVQQIAAESGMSITGISQYEDGKMEILLEDYA